MKLKFKNFIKNSGASTAIEYALIAAGIGVVLFATLAVIGSSLASKFDYLSTTM